MCLATVGGLGTTIEGTIILHLYETLPRGDPEEHDVSLSAIRILICPGTATTLVGEALPTSERTMQPTPVWVGIFCIYKATAFREHPGDYSLTPLYDSSTYRFTSSSTTRHATRLPP